MATEEERIEFHAQVAATASKVVRMLMTDSNDLGPIDSAFALGAAAKLVAGVFSKTSGIPLAEVEEEVFKAVTHGFKVTKADVIELKPH